MLICALAALTIAAAPASPDTVFLEVGSPEVDARVYAPHRARVQVRLGAPDGPVVAEWINELTHGDSAGRPVHRWVTSGTQMPVNGPRSRFGSDGIEVQLKLEGRRVSGRRKGTTGDFAPYAVELDRVGYVAGASDLVPMAMKLRPGLQIVAPMWGPNMQQSASHIFSVIGEEDREVEGKVWKAWRIEERRLGEDRLLSTWWMVSASPYMVAGEVIQPNGMIRYMTEIAVPD